MQINAHEINSKERLPNTYNKLKSLLKCMAQ